MRVAPPGKFFVLGGLAVAGTALLAPVLGWGQFFWLGLFFAAFSAYFFRDPERPCSYAPHEIGCPADGTVMSVNATADGGVLIRIFLAIWDVHVQRVPVSGRVESIVYTPGTFAFANAAEAEHNERNAVAIVDAKGRRVVVEQIAGWVARRIECWLRVGQSATQGKHLGVIYFGSQAAVHLPPQAEPRIKPGDTVRGNITVLGVWKA